MEITSRAEYDAAATRANTLSDAPEGTLEARELTELVAALRIWDEAHAGEQSNGAEEVPALTRADDLSVSGLPGNLGKLHKD